MVLLQRQPIRERERTALVCPIVHVPTIHETHRRQPSSEHGRVNAHVPRLAAPFPSGVPSAARRFTAHLRWSSPRERSHQSTERAKKICSWRRWRVRRERRTRCNGGCIPTPQIRSNSRPWPRRSSSGGTRRRLRIARGSWPDLLVRCCRHRGYRPRRSALASRSSCRPATPAPPARHTRRARTTPRSDTRARISRTSVSRDDLRPRPSSSPHTHHR